jgi:type IV fimbrial biogenesis protein FimT
MMGEPAIYSGQPVRRGLSRTLSGFTLVELMVTIAVVAVLLAIAVPSFNNATLGGKLSSYANNFVASAHLARSEAIKRNAAVTLCVSTNGTSCAAGGWEQGWIVLAVSTATVVQRQQALPTGMKATGSVASLSFQPSGVGATSASVTICRATPTVGGQERRVSISATGQATVLRTTLGACG